MLLKMTKSIMLLLIFSLSVFGQVVQENDPQLQGIDVTEHLGEYIPLDLQFTNDKGEFITLDHYFNKGKPVIIVMAYYECPMLCTFVLNGLTDVASKLSFTPGKEYQIVTISIDPKETARLARVKKETHIEALKKSGAENGWDFLVGAESSSKRLADALGFKYYYDEERDEYAHPAVIFVITEEGKISRYLFGINYQEKDLRFALMEASTGNIGDVFDKFLLYCFHYDPEEKAYVIFAGNVMKIGGVITILLLGIVLITLWKKESNRKLALTEK
jgi:protein SCO1/2